MTKAAIADCCVATHDAQCREAGMDGQITKPVDYETLIHAVKNAIARIPPSNTEVPRPPGAGAQGPPARIS